MPTVSLRTLGIGLLAPLLVGCQAGQAEMEPLSGVEVVGQADHCNRQTPGLSLVQSMSDFPQVDGLLPAGEGALEAGHDVLVVYLGQRPTPGYGGELRQAQMVDGNLELSLNATEPESGSIMAQVITTPCVALAIPEQGWSSLSVRMGADGFPLSLEAPTDR
ncbi:protease complex subunit PrcB family protein [Vreelandella utahensis]|uniref:protease complex subunit PrcB family protein n=1 Tax=Vreelandella halophila TaxID=86177 RepID=UPI0009873AF3|nr:protease complex subunit PrcB family protein [Halomonas utahensis]